MRIPSQNLAPVTQRVNPPSGSRLKAAICNFAVQTGQDLKKQRRAPYLRRLHLLAAGNPRAMNFATEWCIALHNLSELPPFGTDRRKRVRDAWQELQRATTFVVAEIQAATRSCRG